MTMRVVVVVFAKNEAPGAKQSIGRYEPLSLPSSMVALASGRSGVTTPI